MHLLHLRKPVRNSIFLRGFKFFKRIFLAVAGSQSLPERFERCEVKEVNFPQPLLGDEFQANPFNVRVFYISTRRNATSVYSGIVLNCVGF